MVELPNDKRFESSGLLFAQVEVEAMNRLSNKEGNMRTKKQLIVCLTVCFVLFFIAAVYAAPSVTVINTNAKPIPVTEVRREPIAKELTVKICAPCGLNCAPPCSPVSTGWYANGTIYTVPIGKQLVIEYFSCKNVSMGGNFGSYSTSYTCYISPRTSGVYVDHYLPTTPYGHHFIQDIEQLKKNPPAFMSAGQRVQLYGDSASEVLVGVFRQNDLISSWSSDYEEYIYFSFSGYLVDIAP
jgi:hypothetical protein